MFKKFSDSISCLDAANGEIAVEFECRLSKYISAKGGRWENSKYRHLIDFLSKNMEFCVQNLHNYNEHMVKIDNKSDIYQLIGQAVYDRVNARLLPKIKEVDKIQAAKIKNYLIELRGNKIYLAQKMVQYKIKYDDLVFSLIYTVN